MSRKVVLVLAPVLATLAGAWTKPHTTSAGVDPGRFVARIDNPWFPLPPGTTFVYHGEKDGRASRDLVTVTHRTRLIQGVRAIAVRDLLYLDGKLEERTTDWYAQDRGGTVWYFGEATAELDRRGRVTSTEGSWLAGRDGAQPGIFMPARPRPGQAFRQEHYAGHAEDHFEVLSVRARAHTPYVSTRRALLTREWTPLEPGVLDHKLYVRGVGNVREQTVRGGSERAVLVSVRHD